MISPNRDLPWGDLPNARDLGGLPAREGITERGRIFRSASPDTLDATGWSAIANAGVTTVVDLRNDDEVGAATFRPSSITVARRPIEDRSDAEFMAQWGDRLGTPVYYSEILDRWPGLVAAAVTTIADAPDGAVLLHCASGQDRTGMIAAIVLQVAGVEREAILSDYAAGVRGNNEWWRVNGEPGDAMSDDQLTQRLREILPLLEAFLDGVDLDQYLLDSGVTAEQLNRVRARLLN